MAGGAAGLRPNCRAPPPPCGTASTARATRRDPSETKSRVAIAFEMWKGSVWVTVTVGTSPSRPPARGDPGRDGHGVERGAGSAGSGATNESAQITRSAPERATASAAATW